MPMNLDLPPLKPVFGIGHQVRLKSGGPDMTIVEMEMPAPGAPQGTPILAHCWYFRGEARLICLWMDVRCLIHKPTA